MVEKEPELPEQLSLFPEELKGRESPIGVRFREVATVGPAPTFTGELIPLVQAVAEFPSTTPVRVQFTDNRTVLLSVRRLEGGLILRAHRCFESAPREVVDAVIRLYLTRSPKTERRRLAHRVTVWHQSVAAPPESVGAGRINPGQHHDLRATLERVNRDHFDGRLDLDITFGLRPSRRQLGHHERRAPKSLIVLNPILDHPWITAWYLDFLVFHEMLHEVLPPVPTAKRLLVHPPEFRRRERLHPDYERSQPYEKWIMGAAWKQLLVAAQREQRQRMNRIAEGTASAIPRRKSRGNRGEGAGDP